MFRPGEKVTDNSLRVAYDENLCWLNKESKMSVSTLFNEGMADRLIRIIVGIIVIALVFVGPKTPWGWLGLVPLITGLVGWCPAYTLFGIRTCPLRKS